MVEFPQYSTKQLVKMHLAGEMISCMRDKISGTQMLLSPIIKDLLIPQNKSVYITHDYLLGMLYGMLTDLPIHKVEEEWFSYLDGVCLQLTEQNKIMLYRKSKRLDVTEALNKLQIQFHN